MPRCLILAALGLGLSAGCAQPGPMSSRRTVMGGLKSSVSQLESEKEDLRKQVADLKGEYRRLEDRYAQEVSTNNELADRLDGARSILKKQGADTGLASADTRIDDEPPSAIPPPRRVTPSGRSSAKSRKAPFTQIQARPQAEESADERNELPEPDADITPHASLPGNSHWSSIVRGDGNSGTIR